MSSLHYLFDKPTCTADLRTFNSDFIVKEMLPFSPTGEGEHHMIHVRKEGLNTNQVAEILAKFAKVHQKEVTYAGQKDRNAVTEQWFGVRIPGKETPDWQSLSTPVDEVSVGNVNDETHQNQTRLTILSSQRHSKKLRIGALLGNRFELTLRNVSDKDALEKRIQQVMETGVPNYFGEQRFGHQGKNLIFGQQMLAGKKVKDRKKRSIYLSAVRSNVFNQVVSYRLHHHSVAPLTGDCVMLAGSKSFFVAEKWDPATLKRLSDNDIQLSAPLWGRGSVLPQADAALVEQTALAELTQDLTGLEQAGLEQERRPLLLKPQAMKYRFEQDSLVIEFILPAGSYATSVLRELLDYQDVQEVQRQQMVAEQNALIQQQKLAEATATNQESNS
ncbi:tRNA pseudouridine(13) synthase TruD [Shewanella sp. 1_MG-2023]|uniref:tRNA pseudouridine(13) synthase TruD n=1 Tax=unclassified Shewanella TaxID=196818 RepID=UPI000C8568C3|nr:MULTISPECIES: tRNA pseudouridine(13) synthase TruD [unclassified Shewanella]MDO6610264.1 tRNA pseudouridine(13) synthase TruD [Shewanella sp. 7_MG-2023]MDO6770389.1 tRNA pseudouridine(13) synthase TruD [Shewanella sp. 2_MG-2023]MDO6795913.1 tRNA pseudouridine(13) synthase TruD [Shewanella sp. 1_MG-2023]PMG78834.1 tRNA pseudouridine(13) synthase TruD [Shewanella sp. 10N.286.51.B7]